MSRCAAHSLAAEPGKIAFGGTDIYVRSTFDFDIDAAWGPAFIRLRVTPEWLEMQLKRSAACFALGLDSARAKETPTYIHEPSSEVSSLAWCIVINEDSFRMTGASKDGGNIWTRYVEFDDLALALKCAPDSVDIPQDYAWYGGSLFFCGDGEDVDEFVSEVSDELPEVDAKATEMKMESVIGANGPSLAPASGTPAPRALRHGV